jgi:ligand-binding sensor domain-containing protein
MAILVERQRQCFYRIGFPIPGMRTIMKKPYILLCFLVASSPASDRFNQRIHRTNTRYEQGDWITYSSTRYVRHLSLGDRYVYFATTGGITRLDFYTNRYDYPWTMSNGLASNDIYLVAHDFNTGILWCVTAVGVSYLEPAAKIWNNVYFDELRLGQERITSIGFGDDRKVYLVTSNNHWLESANTSADFNNSTPPSSTITWFGALAPAEPDPPYLFMSDGYMYREVDKTITDFKLRKFRLTCWLRDRFQNLYIGVWGLGAGVANMATYRLDMLRYGLWDPIVDAIDLDQDTFWLGGIQNDNVEHAGVTEWAVERQAPNYYEAYLNTGFSDDRVKSIAVDDPNVWFGTRNGLVRFDRKKNIWRSYNQTHHLLSNRINDVLVDKDFVWVATDAGVSRVVKKTVGTDSIRIQSVQYAGLGTVPVYDLDQQLNLVWMGTEFGIYVYDAEKDSGGFYKGAYGPANQATYAVSVFKDEVWFGTKEGVAGFDSEAKEWLTGPGRLYDSQTTIHRILATEEAVWVATDNGVLKFDRERQRWVHYTLEDGLPDMRVYALFPDGDYIWFGTAAGLTQFYWNSPHRID